MTHRRPPDQVMWPLRPEPGESLLSWLVRVARHNVHPSCYTVLRRSGLAYESRPYAALDGGVDVAILARALAAATGEVEARIFLPSANRGFVFLDGVEVRRDDIVTAERRFSPAMRPGDVHVAQAMYRTLPFCPRTWRLLHDACPACGRVQRWRHAWALDRCDGCSRPLRQVRSASIPSSRRAALAQIAGLVDADRTVRRQSLESISPDLGSLEAGDALELAVALACIIDPRLPLDRPARAMKTDQARLVAALAEAWVVMVDWPDAFERLARRVIQEGSPVARTRLSALLQGDHRASMLPRVRAAMAVRRHAFSSTAPSSGRLLVKQAARRLAVTESRLSADRNEGLLASHVAMRDGRLLLNLDGGEIKRLEQARRDRTGSHNAGRHLGLPAYGVEDLADAGLLVAEDHAWLAARFGAPVITWSAVRSLQEKLMSAAGGQMTDQSYVLLADVMRAYGGGPKPWPAIVGMLLRRALPFRVSGEVPSTRTIAIRLVHVDRCLRLPAAPTPVTLNQADALELLNLLPKHASALQPYSVGGGSSGWRLDGQAVVGLAREFASYAELIALTGLFPRTIRDLLLDAGCTPPSMFGWRRDEKPYDILMAKAEVA